MGSMTSKNAIRDLVKDQLLPAYWKQRRDIDFLDCWYRWSPEKVKVHRRATAEHRTLRDMGETPWLWLTVKTTAQGLFAETVNGRDEHATARFVDVFRRNRWAQRQPMVHREGIAYGQSFVQVLPGDPVSQWTAKSPRRMLAMWRDEANDEYPETTLEVVRSGDQFLYTVMDEGQVYRLSSEGQDGVAYIDDEVHGTGVTPVVRYVNFMDSDGRVVGEVEPYINVARRLNKTEYDRMLIQHFNSWKVRTATGLEGDAPSDEETEQLKMQLAQSDILTGGDGVTYGTLDETNLGPILSAREADIEILSALTQTPPNITGRMVNIGAEALAFANAMYARKLTDLQRSYGESNAQVLRLSAWQAGNELDAEDWELATKWADFETQSMSQAVDALGKAAQMLEVPKELLWDRIPTVTAQEAEQWRKHADENPSASHRIADALGRARGADLAGE